MPRYAWEQRAARRAILWAGLTLLLLQVAWFPLHPAWHPDTEFAARWQLLQQRRTEQPDSDLYLAIGSSRMALGFHPESLSLPPSGPLVFNFSRLGAGPTMQRLTLQRLLDQGVRPRGVLLEVMPALLCCDPQRPWRSAATFAELPWVCQSESPFEAVVGWARSRVWPWYRFRRHCLDCYAPMWSLPLADHELLLDRLGGWAGLLDELPRDQRILAEATTRQVYQRVLAQFAIRPQRDLAIRTTIRLARQHGVEVTLIRMPEGELFRSMLPPAARSTLDAYFAELARSESVRCLDALDWLSDTDFFDGHHVLRSGASKLTQRLAQQWLLLPSPANPLPIAESPTSPTPEMIHRPNHSW